MIIMNYLYYCEEPRIYKLEKNLTIWESSVIDNLRVLSRRFI